MSTATGSETGAPSSSSVSVDSIRAIAKKDFQDAVRSWMFWILSAFFFLLLVVITGAISYFGTDIAEQGATTGVLLGIVGTLTRMIIPLIALILGWKAIVGERQSGSIKVLLSLPHSRTDVVLGKVLGRSAVLSVSLLIGFSLAGVIVALVLGGFDIVDYGGLLAASVIYGVAFTSFAVAVSAWARSRTVAILVLVATVILFYLAWEAILIAGFALIGLGYLPDTQAMEQILLFVYTLDPGVSYSNALSLVVSSVDPESGAFLQGPGGDSPFFLEDWFSLFILFCWASVPLSLSTFWFNRGDI